MTALTAAEFVSMAPLASAAKGRVTAAEFVTWSAHEQVIRTCCHCKCVYRNAGYAWSCEHWHERHRTS